MGAGPDPDPAGYGSLADEASQVLLRGQETGLKDPCQLGHNSCHGLQTTRVVVTKFVSEIRTRSWTSWNFSFRSHEFGLNKSWKIIPLSKIVNSTQGFWLQVAGSSGARMEGALYVQKMPWMTLSFSVLCWRPLLDKWWRVSTVYVLTQPVYRLANLFPPRIV